jgi:hypothetical protein
MNANQKRKHESDFIIQRGINQTFDSWHSSRTNISPISYEHDSIIFDNSPLSAAKSLKVNIFSTETTEIGILQWLHSITYVFGVE